MATDPRLAQLSRMLGTDLEDLGAARRVASDRPGDLADALVGEAADSDDVTSAATAMDYLEGRLQDLAGLLEGATAEAVRRTFQAKVATWDSAP